MVRDFADTDRQLEQLGKLPSDVANLLTRALGPDRSLAQLDAVLAEMAEGAPQAASPVRAGIPARRSRRSSSRVPAAAGRRSEPAPTDGSKPKGSATRSTLIGLPSSMPPQTPVTNSPELEAETAALLGAPDPQVLAQDLGEPEVLLRSEAAQAEPELSFTEPLDEEDERAPQGSVDSDTGPWQLPTESAPSVEPLVNAAAFADPTERASENEAVTALSRSAPPPSPSELGRERARTEALLDQDLDPADFPARPTSPDGVDADEELEAADEDDFELLIDDEEILEIEELEDDEP
jgi:hypothetical protein